MATPSGEKPHRATVLKSISRQSLVVVILVVFALACGVLRPSHNTYNVVGQRATLSAARFPSIEWVGRPTERVIFFDDASTAVTVYSNNFPGSTFWRDFWNWVNRNDWEPDTFIVLKHFLKDDPEASYIDFGAWVGPTVLFAAQFSKHVYALEPDPLAYSALVANVNLNPHIRERTQLHFGCISSQNGPIEFGGVGDSTTRTSDSYPGGGAAGMSKWSLNCSTLPTFIHRHNIQKLRLIKMDTEGAELFILPSLTHWLQSLPSPKPTIWLSVHCPFWKAGVDENAVSQFWSTLRLYKHVYNGPYGEPVDAAGVTCDEFCSFLLTDEKIEWAASS